MKSREELVKQARAEIDDLINRMIGYHKPYDKLLEELLVSERLERLMIQELLRDMKYVLFEETSHAVQGPKAS